MSLGSWRRVGPRASWRSGSTSEGASRCTAKGDLYALKDYVTAMWMDVHKADCSTTCIRACVVLLCIFARNSEGRVA